MEGGKRKRERGRREEKRRKGEEARKTGGPFSVAQTKRAGRESGKAWFLGEGGSVWREGRGTCG